MTVQTTTDRLDDVVDWPLLTAECDLAAAVRARRSLTHHQRRRSSFRQTVRTLIRAVRHERQRAGLVAEIDVAEFELDFAEAERDRAGHPTR